MSNVQANGIADNLMNIIQTNEQLLNVALNEGAFEASHVEKLVAMAIKSDPTLDQFKYGRREVRKITNLVNEIISQSDLKAMVEKKMGKGLAKKKAEPAPGSLPTMIQSDGPIKANFNPDTGHVTIENYGADTVDVSCNDDVKAKLEPVMSAEGDPTGDYDVYCPVPEASAIKIEAASKAAPASKKKKK